MSPRRGRHSSYLHPGSIPPGLRNSRLNVFGRLDVGFFYFSLRFVLERSSSSGFLNATALSFSVTGIYTRVIGHRGMGLILK